MQRADLPVRKLRLSETGPDSWVLGLSAEQRVAMVWQLSDSVGPVPPLTFLPRPTSAPEYHLQLST